MKMKFSIILILITLFCFCGQNHSVVAAENVPMRVQMVLMKISPLFEEGQYNEAITILETFKNKKNDGMDNVYDNAEINFALGNCYMLLGELKKARAFYLLTVTRNAKHLAGWQNLAKTEFELENYIPASTAFRTAYQLTEEKDAKLLYYCAVNLLMAQQYTECLSHFDTLLQKHPDEMTLEWKENLIYALIQADKPRKALRYIKELAENFTGKKQQRWQEILLQQYMALDMRTEAIDLVHILTRKAPTNPIWWKALTHIQLQENHYDKALAAMTIYSYLSPMKPDEEKLLGDLYMQQGVPLKAVINYENYTKSVENSNTFESLIRAYLHLGRPELALLRLKEHGSIFTPQKLSLLQGEIHYLEKDYKQASHYFTKAANRNGNENSRASLMAAYSYWQIGNLTEAREFFQRAAQSKLFKTEAEKAIKQLTLLTKTNNVNRINDQG